MSLSSIARLTSALDSLESRIEGSQKIKDIRPDIRRCMDDYDTAIQALQILSDRALGLIGLGSDAEAALKTIANYLYFLHDYVHQEKLGILDAYLSLSLDDNQRKNIKNAADMTVNKIVFAWASQKSTGADGISFSLVLSPHDFIKTFLLRGLINPHYCEGASSILAQVFKNHNQETLRDVISYVSDSKKTEEIVIWEEISIALKSIEPDFAFIGTLVKFLPNVPRNGLNYDRVVINIEEKTASALLHIFLAQERHSIDVNIVSTLLNKGANPCAYVISSDPAVGEKKIKETALHKAARCVPDALPIILGHLQKSQVSLNLATCLDHDGKTPLHLAAAGSAHGIAALIAFARWQIERAYSDRDQIFIALKTLVNSPDEDKFTAFFGVENVDAARVLVAAGADLRAVNYFGLTPAHFMARKKNENHAEILAYMLTEDRGLLDLAVARPPEILDEEAENAKEYQRYTGKTLFHFAAEERAENGVLELIISKLEAKRPYGIKSALSAVDGCGYTPISCAVTPPKTRVRKAVSMPKSIQTTLIALLDKYAVAANPTTTEGELLPLDDTPLYHALISYPNAKTPEPLMLKLIEKTDLSASRQDMGFYGPALLALAASTGSTVIFEAIVAKGLSPDGMIVQGFDRKYQENKRPLLFDVVSRGTPEMLEHFTITSATITSYDSEFNILHEAILSRRDDMLGILLDKCTDDDLIKMFPVKMSRIRGDSVTPKEAIQEEIVRLELPSNPDLKHEENHQKISRWKSLLQRVSAAEARLFPPKALLSADEPPSKEVGNEQFERAQRGPNVEEAPQWYSLISAYLLKGAMFIAYALASLKDNFLGNTKSHDWLVESRAQKYINKILAEAPQGTDTDHSSGQEVSTYASQTTGDSATTMGSAAPKNPERIKVDENHSEKRSGLISKL